MDAPDELDAELERLSNGEQELGADDVGHGSAPFLSVVLPAHNEVTLLGSTVTNLVSGLDDRGLSYEIIVVENGSSDGTLRLARVLSNQLVGVRVLSLAYGDYGAALYEGFVAARGELVASFDVDYYDLAFLDAALVALEEKDAVLVLASKRAPGARDRRPLVRRLLTEVFARTLKGLVGLEVSDAHGMKLFRRAPLVSVLATCVMRQSLLDVEMVLRATKKGLSITELPAYVVERRAPRTSVSRRVAESLIGIVALRRALAREAKSRASPRRRRRA